MFLRTIDAYCNRYGVTPRDRRRLLLHYPLFKTSWLSVYGRRSRSIARSLTHLFDSHLLVHEVDGPRGRVRVPISFEPHDLASFREIFFGGEYDAPFDLSRATSAIDLGANTGMAALNLLTRAPLEKLVLVEANPALLNDLRTTMAPAVSSGIARIEHVCVVGTPRAARVRFFVPADHRMARLLDGADPGEPGRRVDVPARTLGELLDAHGLATVDVLKVDIEGGEHALLTEDPDAFSRARVVFAEVHGAPEVRQGWVDRLCALGYEIGRRRADAEGSETMVAARAPG